MRQLSLVFLFYRKEIGDTGWLGNLLKVIQTKPLSRDLKANGLWFKRMGVTQVLGEYNDISLMRLHTTSLAIGWQSPWQQV